jgi:hypothetical protein
MPDSQETGPSGRAEQRESGPVALATLDRQRHRDAAAALVFASLLLFASPLLDLAAGAGPLAGIPLGVLYIFGAWLALIVATSRLARHLLDDGPP